MTSLSNMPAINRGEHCCVGGSGEDYVWDHYQESVKMSTYLVAFTVSKYDFRETIRQNNVRLRIWADKRLLDQAEYALQLGAKILENFESYFDLDYSLPKLDLVAIPDFIAGGMENWGLVTLGLKSVLLAPRASSSYKQKLKIGSLIAHEVAHQWFG